MAAGVRYRKARFVVAAAVATGVVGGTAYFARSAPAAGTDASDQDVPTAKTTTMTSQAAPTLRQTAPVAAPAKRSRGS